MANPAQEASLADLLQKAGIDPNATPGVSTPPPDADSGYTDIGFNTPPSMGLSSPGMGGTGGYTGDKGLGANGIAPLPVSVAASSPDPSLNPPQAAPQASFLDSYRAQHPEYGSLSDIELARQMYTSFQPKDTFPEFATRMGINLGTGETLANSGLTNAALHLNQPLEALGSGIGGLFTGDGFGPKFNEKMQELRDQESIGQYQHPNASGIGNMIGTAASYMGLGKGLKAIGDEIIPGMKVISGAGKAGEAATTMASTEAANELVPATQDAANHPDGFNWEGLLADEGGAFVRGLAAGAAGTAVAKTFSSGISPILRGVSGGIDKADALLKGLPRTLYTKAAAKMGGGFAGAADSPLDAANQLDTNYYSQLLDNGTVNVNKSIAQLGKIANQPGGAAKIWQAMGNSADSDVPDAGTMMDQIVNRVNTSSPTEQQQLLTGIYKNIVPQRLAGSFDPAAPFSRTAMTGGVDSKLIQPPLRALSPGSVGQSLWERMGGGPGRVMWAMANQPKGAVGGGLSVAANLASLGPSKAAQLALKGAAGASDFLGNPVGTALKMLPRGMQPQGASQLPGMWSNYLNYEGTPHGPLTNPLDTLFPDIYNPPLPDPTAPGHVSTHAELMNWLGTADRQTAMSYVGSKLGPQVQQQLANASNGNNWKAALFNLASDPKSRAALMPADETA